MPVQILTTHPPARDATWKLGAALLNDINSWLIQVPNLDQLGLNAFCTTAVPGYEKWVGRDVVFWTIRNAVDGYLFWVSIHN